MDPTSTDLKRNGTQPFVTLQKPAFLMVWECNWWVKANCTSGNDHQCWKACTGFRATYTPCSDVTFRKGLAYFKKTRRVRVLNWPSIYILHSASMTRAWVIKEYSHILFWCIQLKAAKKKKGKHFLNKNYRNYWKKCNFITKPWGLTLWLRTWQT